MKRTFLLVLFAAGLLGLAVSVSRVPPAAPHPASHTTAPPIPVAVDPTATRGIRPDLSLRNESLVRERMRKRRLLEDAALDLARDLNDLVLAHEIPQFDDTAYAEDWDMWHVDDWYPGGTGTHFLRELQAFAVERPDMFGRMMAHIDAPEDTRRGRLVASLKSLSAESAKCAAFVRALDPLHIPSVRDRRREAIACGPTPGLPQSPWIDGENVTGAWDMGGPEREDRLLFDDGVLRSASQGLWLVNFPDEIERFLDMTAGEPLTPELLWRTAIFARWGMEHGDYEAGLACYRRVLEMGNRASPGDGAAELGLRAAAQGLTHIGSVEKGPDPSPTRTEQRRERLDDLISRRKLDRRRWEKIPPWKLLNLPRPEQAEVAIWLAGSWNSPELAADSLYQFLADIREGPALTDHPAAWLRSLGWDAVPVLLDHLDDRTWTATLFHEHTLRIGDLCWLSLRAFTGLPDPPSLDPDAPWITRSRDLPAFCISMEDWWNRVRDLPEEERWADLFERGSAPATAWLLEHDPERFFAKAWDRTDATTHRGAVERVAIERSLALAPREKLEALLEKTEGEAREAVTRALTKRNLEDAR